MKNEEDLRTLCYEHKGEMLESGLKLDFIKKFKLEKCDKCEKLGFTYCIIGEKHKNRRWGD